MPEWLKLIAPPLLTVGVGGYLLNRFFVGRATLAAVIERVCNVLDELRDDCASYWSVDYPKAQDKIPEQFVLETKIKAEVLQISALVHLIAEKRNDVPDVLRLHLIDLQDYCTGGDFESKQRRAEKERYMRIMTCINSIAVELQRLKIWPARILPRFLDDVITDMGLNRGRPKQSPWHRD